MPVTYLPGHEPRDDVDPPSGGGDDDGMNERIARLEALIPTLATKEDLARLETGVFKAINEQTWKLIGWTAGIGAALVAVAYYIARNVH